MALIQTCQIQAIWQFHTSPPFIQNSFEQRLQLLYEIHDRKTLMSSVYFFLFPWECLPRQTCNNHLRRKKKMCHRSNSDCCMTILLRQPWEELVPWEQTPWHWSKHVKFRPSWLFQKACLSSALSNCNLDTCWHISLLTPEVATCWHMAFYIQPPPVIRDCQMPGWQSCRIQGGSA